MEICTIKTRGTYCPCSDFPALSLIPVWNNTWYTQSTAAGIPKYITGPTSLNSSTPGGSPPLHRRWHRRNISPQEVGSVTQNYQVHYKKAMTFLFSLRWSVARTISTGSSTCSGGDLIHQGLEGMSYPCNDIPPLFYTSKWHRSLSLVDHNISNEAKAVYKSTQDWNSINNNS